MQQNVLWYMSGPRVLDAVPKKPEKLLLLSLLKGRLERVMRAHPWTIRASERLKLRKPSDLNERSFRIGNPQRDWLQGPARQWILPITTAVLAGVIFAVDTVTDLEIAVAVFYVAVVLMSVAFYQRRGVVLVAGGCTALTLMSYVLTPTGDPDAGLINGIISVSAIGVTTYLALKIESARLAMHEAQSQLAHVARVTTLGELSVTIAHEMNQPLAGVVTNGNACLRWLASERPNLEEARQAASNIVEDANRASKIVSRVRALLKRTAPKVESLNINDVIGEIIILTRAEMRRNRITLRTELAEGLPLVLGDRIQLQQVVLNLIVNAIEAQEDAGEAPREILIRSNKQNPNRVLVAVMDHGKGLTDEEADRMFEPFHTTKSDGLGIGLTVARSIVEAHGGSVWAVPNAPRGAIVQFTLPIERDRAA
jgi:signal transduction histidine kinase